MEYVPPPHIEPKREEEIIPMMSKNPVLLSQQSPGQIIQEVLGGLEAELTVVQVEAEEEITILEVDVKSHKIEAKTCKNQLKLRVGARRLPGW